MACGCQSPSRSPASPESSSISAGEALYPKFDGFYDSDLFQHHLTDEVFIDSVTIEDILNGLYEIPGGMASYDFSIADADANAAGNQSSPSISLPWQQIIHHSVNMPGLFIGSGACP